MTQSLSSEGFSTSRPVVRGLMVAALAAGAWAMSTAASDAHASDVYWSVGVQSPGVALGVSNAPPAPVYVQRPRPVYVQPAPVVVYPGYRHVRPVVMAPEPVYYYQEPPRYVYVEQWAAPIGPRDYRYGHGGKHHGHGHGRGHDRR